MTAAQPSPTYSPWLEGVIAGETAICQVDPNAGLLYRGYDIEQLATRLAFEQIAYLLLYGDLPNGAEHERFRQALAKESTLPEAVPTALGLMPRGTHPVDALRTGLSML